MLAIRMQRTGRTGHANFRVIVQDSTQSPTSGKVVAQLGSYDPHTKATILDKEKAAFYLEHGAQPSDRTAMLLKKEGVKLPSWVQATTKKSSVIRHPEKLRRNRPDEPVAPVAETAPAEEPVVETETPVEAEAATEEVSTEAEAPAEQAPVEAEALPEVSAPEEVADSAETAEPEAEKVPEEPAV